MPPSEVRPEDPDRTPDNTEGQGLAATARAKVKTQVEWQLTEIVYQQQILGNFSAPFLAAAIAFLVWDEIPRAHINGWLIFFGIVALTEWTLCGAFYISRKRSDVRSPSVWLRLHLALAIFEALPLVISGVFFFPLVSPSAQIGLIALNAAVAATGASLFVANLPAAIAYGVTIIGGIAIGLFTMGGETGTVIGTMCFVYVGFLSFSAVEYHRIVYSSVTFRRRSELLTQRLRKALSSVRKAEASARAKTYFLSRIGHEMRTPMHRVIGNGELLRQMSDGEPQTSLCDDLLVASKEMMRVIENVLDYTNVVSGNLTLAADPFSVSEIAYRALKPVQSAAAEKKLDVQLHVENDLPETMLGDSRRISQILENLVDNAVRYTDTGRVDISISLADSGGILRFAVRDTGIGIDPDLQKILFSSSFQVGNTRPRQLSGTGLGLAICRELVDIMGGTISAVSAPGEGSTFSFDIPVVSVRMPTIAAA